MECSTTRTCILTTVEACNKALGGNVMKVQNMGVKLGLGANVGPGVIPEKGNQTDFHIMPYCCMYESGEHSALYTKLLQYRTYTWSCACTALCNGPVLSPTGVYTEVG